MNKCLLHIYMMTNKNYIDLLRCILKNFDNEFDDVIIRILPKIFDDYYMNRFKKIIVLIIYLKSMTEIHMIF